MSNSKEQSTYKSFDSTKSNQKNESHGDESYQQLKEKVVVMKYLTPYKIALAALIMIYLQNSIPFKQKSRIMGHIISNLENDIESASKAINSKSGSFFQGELSELELIVGSETLTTSEDETVFDALLDILFAMKSINELHSFIDNLENLVVHLDGNHDEEDSQKQQFSTVYNVQVVRSSSMLGNFFTKITLEFGSQTFDQVTLLWNCIVDFRGPYLSYVKKWSNIRTESHYSRMRICFGENFKEHDDYGFNLLKLLLNQVQPYDDRFTKNKNESSLLCMSSDSLKETLEAKVLNIDNDEGVAIDDISHLINILESHGKSIPVAGHYIKYHNSLQDHDYEGAFEHLHRYFDYSMLWRGRAQYHYALYGLATLHAAFGSFNEAIRAVSEAISVARENNDISALTAIHFWLYSFEKLHPECIIPDSLSSRDQLLSFLKAKSHDTSFSLYALSLLFEAQQCMKTSMSNIFYSNSSHSIGNSHALTIALESMFKSAYMSIISNSLSSYSQYILLKSSIWHKLGESAITLFSTQLSLEFSKKSKNKWVQNESICKQASILYQKGDIIASFQFLESGYELTKGSQLSFNQWRLSFLKLKLEHSLNAEKLNEARYLLNQIASLTSLGIEAKIAFELGTARLLVKYKEFSKAKKLIDKFLANANENYRSSSSFNETIDAVYQLDILMVYALIVMKTDSVSKATDDILRLIFISEYSCVHSSKYYGLVLLADVLYHEGEISEALSLMDSIMPAILETEYAKLIGFGYCTLAKITLSIVSKSRQAGIDELEVSEEISINEKHSLLEKTLEYLNKSGKYYEMCQCWIEVREIFQLMEQLGRLNSHQSLIHTSRENIERLTKLIEINRKSTNSDDAIFQDISLAK